MKEQKINTAIVGFGLSGKVFHGPFIHVHPGFKLSAIMTSGEEAARLYPESKIVRNYEDILDDQEIGLVIICSPNEFHYEQARHALEAGKDVILEKPFTPTLKEAKELFDIALKKGRQLFPFQNRRWDGDFLTVKHILKEGYLGKVLDFETHFDRFNPEVGRASWRYQKRTAGGTLYDLGIHLVDQVVVLFGKPDAVYCRLFNQRENSIVDDSFDLKLIYPGLNVTVKAGVFVKEKGPRFAVHGTLGSFVKSGLDPQEASLRKGHLPQGKDWGKEAKKHWGILHTEFNRKKIRVRYETLPGNYMGFFDQVYKTLTMNEKPAIKQEEVLTSLAIIEKAIKSDQTNAVIPF